LGLSDRIRAKVVARVPGSQTRIPLPTPHYVGYCRDHRLYFLDRPHTNNEIRCPQCDEAWLALHALMKKGYGGGSVSP